MWLITDNEQNGLPAALLITCNFAFVCIAKIFQQAHVIEQQREQIKQLTKIVERCGVELVTDQDGNYDALIPLTPKEFNDLKKQPPKSNAKPNNLCPKCGVYEVEYDDIGVCPNCEAGNPRFTG